MQISGRFAASHWIRCVRPRSWSRFSSSTRCYERGKILVIRSNLSLGGKSKRSVLRSTLLRQPFSSLEHDPYDKYRQHVLTEDVWKEIEEENEHTRRSIDVRLYDQVFQEILDAVKNIPPPCPEPGPTGKFLYDFDEDTTSGKRKYRRQDAMGSGGYQTVLDVPVDKYDLLSLSLSVDEKLVACLVREISKSDAWYEYNKVLVRHIATGAELELILPEENYEVTCIEFGPLQKNGQHSLFYVTSDDKGRPDAIWACLLQDKPGLDASALQQTSIPTLLQRFSDPSIMVDVQRTKGCQYVSIQANTKTSSEVYLCTDVTQPIQLVRQRQDGFVYHLDVGSNGDLFMLISNNNPDMLTSSNSQPGLELSLWKTSVDALPLPNDIGAPVGTLLAGPQGDYIIADMDIFRSAIALFERSTIDGKQRLRLMKRLDNSDKYKEVIVPYTSSKEECAVVSPGGNMDYNAPCVRFMVESPSFPAKTYEYNMSSGKLTTVSDCSSMREEGEIRQKRLLVASLDGTNVPLSLIYREDVLRNVESRPAVLMGYGSYGEAVNLSFDPALQPLLNRGFVLAFAHTRGGGDLGKSWYHRGRLHHKKRAVEDFTACARAVTSKEMGITKPNKLTAKAFSAGGVVVGAAVNQEPSLFGSVVLTNAFLDVMRTMQNNLLFLTEHEWDEYGNPTIDPRAAESIASYCPVSNAIIAEHRARFLLIGAFDDTQVPFWNAMIYGKKVRSSSRSERDVHIHIESHGGHHLQRSRLDVAALEMAFIIGNRASYYGMPID